MQPRLRLDIGWGDLLSTLPPVLADRTALERRIAAFAPKGVTAVVGLSVRTLFDALLAETAAGRPVAMSAVTIADMAALVRAHGCALHSLDIDLDRLAPPRAALEEAEADAALVVVAALYGPRATFDGLSRTRGALRIEDRAQAFDGALILSPGADVALYSFGPIKTATALGGGVALFRDPDLAARIARRLAAYPSLSEAWFLRRVAKHAALKALSLPSVYALLMRRLSRGGRDPDAAIGAAARGFPGREPIHLAVRRRPPRRMLRLLARRLARWRPSPDAAIDAAAAVAMSALLPVPGRPRGPRWLLPVLHPRPVDLIQGLRRRGFDATRGATSLRAVADDNASPPTSASRLIDQVVYLPRPRDAAGVERLTRACDAALKEIR